ncbi:hypothetical protein CKO15_03490 [Halorhodospira abdelmalekii]|uniref:hypothetical protein n=1 Tax=Halorhodospira abdelmalekii TaxID=421629 RepID=UPI001908B8A1|nr:hypothetical protein [Halorhodospira abdelmalekii]MBK1734362.1 hypothetical protein [Halorhodospira abdelmalekii]
MRKTIGGLLTAGLLVPGVVGAEGLGADTGGALSYSYVDGGLAFYPSVDRQDLVGVNVTGSYAITPDIFAFGGFTYLTDDFDYTAAYGGGAYRFEVMPDFDVYGGLSLEYQKVEGEDRWRVGGSYEWVDGEWRMRGGETRRVTWSEDDISLGIRGGARYLINDAFEVGGQARIVTGDWDYFGFNAYGQYHMTSNLGVVGELDIWDGDLGIIARARYNF